MLIIKCGLAHGYAARIEAHHGRWGYTKTICLRSPLYLRKCKQVVQHRWTLYNASHCHQQLAVCVHENQTRWIISSVYSYPMSWWRIAINLADSLEWYEPMPRRPLNYGNLTKGQQQILELYTREVCSASPDLYSQVDIHRTLFHSEHCANSYWRFLLTC